MRYVRYKMECGHTAEVPVESQPRVGDSRLCVSCGVDREAVLAERGAGDWTPPRVRSAYPGKQRRRVE